MIFLKNFPSKSYICCIPPPQGASLGLASGITGGAAAITKKVLNSQQMKRVEVAIEVHFYFFRSFFMITTNKVDSAATKELATEVEAVRNDNRVQKVFQQHQKQ